MAARSQIPIVRPDGEFNLVTALQACLSPSNIVIGAAGEVLTCSLNGSEFLNRLVTPGMTLAALPEPLADLIAQAKTARATVAMPVLKLHNSEGAARQFHATAVFLALGSGEPTVILNLTDITRLAHWQKSLEQLDRLATTGTLAAGMAHEIKNAFVAIKTFVDLLVEQNKNAELTDLVQHELARVNAIVRQLLKTGPATPEHAPVRLHDVLEHSLLMVRQQLSDKLISLHRTFAATSDVVRGDPHQLEQVFVNLLLNAVEATGTNGSLTVQTEFLAVPTSEISEPKFVGQPLVRVSVADTGTGIAPDTLARMFEPFFTTKSHGTGLGLLISQRIVEQHHGAIHVESQPSKGTTFRVILPSGQPKA